MAQRIGGPWLRVGKAIELFTQMGAVLDRLPGHLEGPDGVRSVRYLYSPITDDFVSLSDYSDEDIIPPSELASWERRLGIEVPKGDYH